MAANKHYQAYQNNSVNTASGGELTLMLYNGCIKFIKQSIKDLQNESFEAKNTNIQKAQNIIHELMVTLDPEVEISQQIMPLYEYIKFQLKEGNVKNDVNLLEEALNYVIEFRDTWKQVIIQTRKTQYAQGAQV
ncbi:flagellar protein FliS [Virgibacillus subterraneus]|uniref:Flagellar secretion chaperone FliS n=2 Tax=Virgibacillus TaxID=84406 RepID=A0A1H0ZDW8_9BACI|nr:MULTISPECIES: flagellar export chaperone FliS [Virgibacillus]SDQ25316.1 flagellar protein FliS [Virgibacillus salinus]SEP90983.1 flagellar protein FliS [Virgibacillus subterraneus]